MARKRIAENNKGDITGLGGNDDFLQKLSNRDKPKPPKQELDKDAFLKLFITQMQNQDPLNPDDSTQMASQLAQFQSLEQMMNVNETLEKMTKEQSMGRAVNLIDFVGKEVKLDNGKLSLKNGKLTDAVFEVDKFVANAQLEVRDGSGAVISTQDIGNLKPGKHNVSWSGLDKKGVKIKDGTYTFNVLAKDAQGQDLPVKITSAVNITGVDLQDNGGSFYTELGKVNVEDIASVGHQQFLMKEFTENSPEQQAKKLAQAEADKKTEKAATVAGAPAAEESPSGVPQEIQNQIQAALNAQMQQAGKAPPPAASSGSQASK